MDEQKPKDRQETEDTSATHFEGVWLKYGRLTPFGAVRDWPGGRRFVATVRGIEVFRLEDCV